MFLLLVMTIPDKRWSRYETVISRWDALVIVPLEGLSFWLHLEMNYNIIFKFNNQIKDN
jgi:hypothetical protein